MKVQNLLNHQPLHFVTGKGGSGKTTVCNLIGAQLKEAQVDVGIANYSLNADDTEPKFNIPTYFWNGSECLTEYVSHQLKVKRLKKVFDKHPLIHSLLNAAPSLKEISFLGKVTSHIRDKNPKWDHDVCVVDAPSTGHFTQLINVPLGLHEAVSIGPIGKETLDIHKLLNKKSSTKYHFVTQCKETDFEELKSLISFFEEKNSIDQIFVWINKISTNVSSEYQEQQKNIEEQNLLFTTISNFLKGKLISYYCLPLILKNTTNEVVQELLNTTLEPSL